MPKFRLLVAAAFIVGVLGVAPTVHAAPAPVSSCSSTPQTTDVVVTQNLICSGTSAIVVGASGIKIDLQGHWIRGDGTHYGVEDLTGVYDNVTVVNGSFRHFVNAVRALPGADHITIDRISALGMTGGNGIRVEGDYLTVKRSNFIGNEGDGIFFVGNNGSISGSTVAQNLQFGVEMVGIGEKITRTTIEGNGKSGLSVSGSATVTSAKSLANLGSGISVGGQGSQVRSSTATFNRGSGIVVMGSDPVIGQLPGKPKTDRNITKMNGYDPTGGANGYGIDAGGATNPRGKNVATGNAITTECNPTSLC